MLNAIATLGGIVTAAALLIVTLGWVIGVWPKRKTVILDIPVIAKRPHFISRVDGEIEIVHPRRRFEASDVTITRAPVGTMGWPKGFNKLTRH